jgi:endo-cleaving rubber dioxygenase
VPNVWQVLTPPERPAIWRRVSAPSRGADADAFMGFDTSLARAYDHEKLGWKYEVLECDDSGLDSALDCRPGPIETSAPATLWFSWNLDLPPTTNEALEARKIYNTHNYSQGNQGHAFAAVLSDAERRALIEYLKTL